MFPLSRSLGSLLIVASVATAAPASASQKPATRPGTSSASSSQRPQAPSYEAGRAQLPSSEHPNAKYQPSVYDPARARSASPGYHATPVGAPSTYRENSTNYRRGATSFHSDSTNYRRAETSYHAPAARSNPNASRSSKTVSYEGVDYHRADAHVVKGIINGRISDASFYRSVTTYHDSRTVVRINTVYARHPNYYHGYWGGGWYHGYWNAYWASQAWQWYNGSYGFWLANANADVFLRETSPGVCSYWNGYAWVAWWNPPYTPYYCPY